MKIEKEIKITSDCCLLHSRASQFVQKAMTFKSVIYISHDEYVMNAKSLLGMMLLKVSADDIVKMIADGEDSAEAINELAKLF